MVRYQLYDEITLIALLETKDELAYEEIFNRYRSILFQFTYSLVKEKCLAEDIVHDTFFHIWDGIDRVKIKSLLAYLFCLAKSKSLMYLRSQKISKKFLNLHIAVSELQLNNADYQLRYNMLFNHVSDIADLLPFQTREIFLLSWQKNLSRRQISDYLCIPIASVNTAMLRALSLIRYQLELKGYSI